MSKKIRVIQYGLGAMGTEMAKIILGKKDLELVGAIINRPEKNGKDVGELIGLAHKVGIRAYNDARKVCNECGADIMLHAAVSYVPKVWEHIQPAVSKGINVITIAEEMGYPFVKYKSLSRKIDLAAKRNDISILGTGINPGFAMDLMPILFSGICNRVDSIRVTRLIDFSPFGPSIQKNIAIGMNRSEFMRKLKTNQLPLHIGLPESSYFLAAALEWKLGKVYEAREPVLAERDIVIPGYMKVKKGTIAGFNHRCFSLIDGKKRIILEELGRVDPKLDYYNEIIINGKPNLRERVNVPSGNITTTNHTVNLIPAVINARPGLLSMMDLPPAPCLVNRK